MQIRVPLSWLREYVDIDVSVDELARLLHMSGTEVDHVERRAWERIWVGRVTKLERHPNADRLTLATVEYGAGRANTVVTGATNLSVGAIVPYAEVGAELIDGGTGDRFRLEPKKVRGIASAGMVCSEKELGLGEDHEGILVLESTLPVGAALADAVGDPILYLELQPNRPDCLGIVGIAREVAALLGHQLRDPATDPLPRAAPRGLDVRIEDAQACPRFAAALLRDVRIAPSPQWLQGRLVAAGMRPIDNVVDITNYVMLELGQPLHAYDHHQVRGGTLVARAARRGETLRTLDQIDRVLPEGALVIADIERSLGLAGILGGEDSEIRSDTTTLALECASFEPRGIGRTATRLGLHGSSGSAAARRFAWELSPDLVPMALARAVRLLREHAGAQVVGVVDRYPSPRSPINVRLRFSDITRVLGMEVMPDETLDVLQRLHFRVAVDGDTLVATPPAIRTDVAIPEDVIEEVARIVGYERLPTRIPDGPLPLHERHPLEEFRERARDVLVGQGLQETVSYALIDPAWLTLLTAEGAPLAPEPLRVTNPTTVTQSVARPTLRASLLDTARRNVRHRESVAIFEIAPVYFPRARDLPEERWIIGVLLAGRAEPLTWLTQPRDFDLYDLQGILEALHRATRFGGRGESIAGGQPGLHPGRSWGTMDKGRVAVVAGQLDPRVAERWDVPEMTFVAEIDLALLYEASQTAQAAVPPRFPPALRDLAVVVDERVAYGDVAREIQATAKELLESLVLLDLYRGPQVGAGKKSFAVRLILRASAGTLSDADVDRVLGRVEGRLGSRLGATLRG